MATPTKSEANETDATPAECSSTTGIGGTTGGRGITRRGGITGSGRSTGTSRTDGASGTTGSEGTMSAGGTSGASDGGGRRGSYQASKTELAHRFRRLSGQLDGVAQMVDDERYCPDVLLQLSAVMAALEKVGYILLRSHIERCVAEGLQRGDGDAHLDELMAVIQRFSGR